MSSRFQRSAALLAAATVSALALSACTPPRGHLSDNKVDTADTQSTDSLKGHDYFPQSGTATPDPAAPNASGSAAATTGAATGTASATSSIASSAASTPRIPNE